MPSTSTLAVVAVLAYGASVMALPMQYEYDLYERDVAALPTATTTTATTTPLAKATPPAGGLETADGTHHHNGTHHHHHAHLHPHIHAHVLPTDAEGKPVEPVHHHHHHLHHQHHLAGLNSTAPTPLVADPAATPVATPQTQKLFRRGGGHRHHFSHPNAPAPPSDGTDTPSRRSLYRREGQHPHPHHNHHHRHPPPPAPVAGDDGSGTPSRRDLSGVSGSGTPTTTASSSTTSTVADPKRHESRHERHQRERAERQTAEHKAKAEKIHQEYLDALIKLDIGHKRLSSHEWAAARLAKEKELAEKRTAAASANPPAADTTPLSTPVSAVKRN